MNLLEKLSSDLNSVPRCIDSVINKVRQLPFNEEQLHDIKLSLEEALVNAIKHGNKLDLRLSVSVSAESSDNALAITVTDQGKGYDFKNVPDPTNAANLSKLSGRGVFLIHNRMDKVEFLSGGCSIKMIKYFKNGVDK